MPKNQEAVTKRSANLIETSFFDASEDPIHLANVIDVKGKKITFYPYSYSERNGLTKRKISEVSFQGWASIDDLPKSLVSRGRISLGHQKISPLMRLLYVRYPKLRKLVVVKDGGETRFSPTTANFRADDLETIVSSINKEIAAFQVRRKTAALNALAETSSQFEGRTTRLAQGGLAHFLSFYEGEIALSSADTDALLFLISNAPASKIKITENFFETRDKINIAYLDNVIEEFEKLMSSRIDNEKAWQRFFDEHGWILAMVFPYQVILHKKEAYVGGKTIENEEARLVDFLYQTGFRDNYALLEIKTHVTGLIKKVPYRKPEAFAQHEACAGAVAQCLDQKRIFTATFGSQHPVLDPKVVLVIGNRSELSEAQSAAFHLLRGNQKHVDIVTFDELLEKLHGLRQIMRIH